MPYRAAIIAGGIVDTTMTPNAKGALPDGASAKEIARLREIGEHEVGMISAYRFEPLPENAPPKDKEAQEHMARYQPIVTRQCDAALIVDVEKLGQGLFEVLAYKESKEDSLTIVSDKFRQEALKTAKDLRKKAHTSAKAEDIAAVQAFENAFADLRQERGRFTAAEEGRREAQQLSLA